MLAHEFFVAAPDPRCGWLQLSEPFAQAMAGRKPQGLYVRMEGCPHDPAWVATVFGGDGAMYLDEGWAAFVR